MQFNAQPTCLPSLTHAIDHYPVTVAPDTPLIEIVTLMNREGGLQTDCVLVMKEMQLVGVCTRGDIFRLITAGLDLTASVVAVMTQPVIALTPFQDEDISRALSTLRQHRIRHLPVVDKQGQLVGMVTPASICQALPIGEATLSRLSEFQQAIAERKQTEVALRQSEARFQKLAANVPGMVYQFLLCPDGSMSILYASSDCRQIYGLEPEQIQQNAALIINMVHPDDVKSFEESVTVSAQTLQPWRWEGRIVMPSGQVKWIQGASRPELRANGDVLWDGLLIDITERKRQEEWLRLMESVVIHANDAVLITEAEPIETPGPRILYVNAAFTRMTGYSSEDVLAKTPRLLQGPNTDQTALEKIRTALKVWQPIFVELINYRKDGSEFWVELSIVPVADKNGWYTHWVSVQRDITERKRTENQIKASLKEKEVLLKEIHHRVRNNLQVISSLLRLQAGCIKDQKALEIFKESQNRVRAMALIHENLYQSKNLAKIDFAEYVRNLGDNLCRSYGINSRTINLKINIAYTLLSVDTVIPCGLIINELVSNSLKYAFCLGEGGEVSINFYSEKRQKYHLIVRDNGRGLPADLDLGKTESLGLNLVATLVEQLEGKIVFYNQGGAVFKITFYESLPVGKS